MTRLYAALATVAVVALAVGGGLAVRGGSDDAFGDCRETTIAGGSAAIGGDFELISETGETVTDEEVLSRPSLVYFGYTFCPDVCPYDAARNADAVDMLAEAGYDVQPVFVSVDPQRDTPEVLAEYTDYLHPDMLGLTGSPAQVRDAAQTYRAFYSVRDADDPDFYLVDHSTFSYLMLPDHGFVELFRGASGPGGDGVSAEEVAERAACFLQAG